MSDERGSGFILRTRRLTETSLIVHWITAEQGRISTVAKGALRPKSPFRGKLDLFYRADFTFSRSRRSDLHTLKEVEVLDIFSSIRTNWPALEEISYAVRLIEQQIEQETPTPGLIALFGDLVRTVDRTGATRATRAAFEIKFLDFLGLAPPWGNVPRAAAEWGQKLQDADWEAISRLDIPEPGMKAVEQFLHGFLIYHLGRIPSGRKTTTLKGGRVSSAEKG